MLDKICTDYESSKQLRKLGINLKTYFYWDIETETIDLDRMPVNHSSKTIIPAYTFEQVLHLLPYKLDSGNEIILSLGIAPHKSLIYSNKSQNYLHTIKRNTNQGDNHATLAARLITQINKLC